MARKWVFGNEQCSAAWVISLLYLITDKRTLLLIGTWQWSLIISLGQPYSIVPQVGEIVVLQVTYVQVLFMCYHNGLVVTSFILLLFFHYSTANHDELATARPSKCSGQNHVFPNNEDNHRKRRLSVGTVATTDICCKCSVADNASQLKCGSTLQLNNFLLDIEVPIKLLSYVARTIHIIFCLYPLFAWCNNAWVQRDIHAIVLIPKWLLTDWRCNSHGRAGIIVEFFLYPCEHAVAFDQMSCKDYILSVCASTLLWLTADTSLLGSAITIANLPMINPDILFFAHMVLRHGIKEFCHPFTMRLSMEHIIQSQGSMLMRIVIQSLQTWFSELLVNKLHSGSVVEMFLWLTITQVLSDTILIGELTLEHTIQVSTCHLIHLVLQVSVNCHMTASSTSLVGGILSCALPSCWPIQLSAIHIGAYQTSSGSRLIFTNSGDSAGDIVESLKCKCELPATEPAHSLFSLLDALHKQHNTSVLDIIYWLPTMKTLSAHQIAVELSLEHMLQSLSKSPRDTPDKNVVGFKMRQLLTVAGFGGRVIREAQVYLQPVLPLQDAGCGIDRISILELQQTHIMVINYSRQPPWIAMFYQEAVEDP